jgi:glycosyltransferase involved in cell wall biosynthesis
MRFSIVVPVYNVENYLAQCVDSIVSQKFDSYECILVDDGSTDSSGEMCDAFASAYASVRVIHKENGGLSSARNAGIKEANGDYLIFVDSDDFIMTDTFLSSLNNVANENHDLVRYQVLRYQTLEDEYTAVTAFNANRYIGLSPLDVLKSMIGDGTLNISAWCIAVRKGFLF